MGGGGGACMEASCGAVREARAPWKAPMGVRLAATMATRLSIVRDGGDTAGWKSPGKSKPASGGLDVSQTKN